jgi:hypothetical protein
MFTFWHNLNCLLFKMYYDFITDSDYVFNENLMIL